MVSISEYIRQNKKGIKRNWEKSIIREKHKYSIGHYCCFWEKRLSALFNISPEHPEIQAFIRELYTTL